MADLSPYLKLLDDALTEETRKERRNLLIASTVGIAIVKAGLIPKEVSLFGVVTDVNERGLLWVLTSVTGYFLLAFLVYAYADFKKHTYTLSHSIVSRMDEFDESHDDYKFKDIDGRGRTLFPTYLSVTPGMEEQFRLWADLKELKAQFKSEEFDKLEREFAVTTWQLKRYEHGAEKETAKGEMSELLARSKDLKRKLTALGAEKVIELQEKESDVNVREAMARNRAKDKLFAETGLDWEILNRFLLAAILKFIVDFVIPIGTGIYATYCLIRGR